MSEPLTKNAGSEEAVKNAARKERDIAERERNDVCMVLSTKQGRRFVWKYLEFCGVFRSTWEASARIHFNEGMRNVGLKLLADVNNAQPEAYLQMMREAKEG